MTAKRFKNLKIKFIKKKTFTRVNSMKENVSLIEIIEIGVSVFVCQYQFCGARVKGLKFKINNFREMKMILLNKISEKTFYFNKL